MTTRTILLVGRKPFESEPFRRLVLSALPLQLCSVADVDDGVDLLRGGQFCLVVVYLGEGEGCGGVDRIMWAVSQARRQVPVVVLSDRYDCQLGVTLFRLGVTDYLALSHHRRKLSRLLRSVLMPGETEVETDSEARQAVVPRKAHPSRT